MTMTRMRMRMRTRMAVEVRQAQIVWAGRVMRRARVMASLFDLSKTAWLDRAMREG